MQGTQLYMNVFLLSSYFNFSLILVCKLFLTTNNYFISKLHFSDIANFFACTQDKLYVADGCDQKAVDMVSDFVRSIAQNVLDLICGDYNDGSDKCAKLGRLWSKWQDLSYHNFSW